MKSVQAVALSGARDLPPQFIRPDTEQPRYTTYQGGGAPEIPVLDLEEENEDLIGAVRDAACKWGLFQVINHGIPNEVIADLQRVGREFFDLPASEKEPYARDPACKCVEGYGTMLRNGWVDHLFNKIWPPSAVDYRFWPKNPPDYRKATEDYRNCLHRVVNQLLRILSLGIGLEAGELKAGIGGEELVYNLKINYYPPCPQPELALGVPSHSDLSALTILVPNQVQGLQVFKDGNWYDVAYIPNALIIHIGDQLEIVSNGRYKAVVHRSVVNKEETRMSWPVFMEPPPEFQVGPHPKLVSEQNPAKYKTKKFGDYAYCKLNGIPQ